MPYSSDSEPPHDDVRMIKLVSARNSVRLRPEMYIRETDQRGILHQLLWNAVNGLCWHSRFLAPSSQPIKIIIQLENDGSASVTSSASAVSAVSLEQSTFLLKHELSNLAGQHPIDLFVVNAFSDHLSVTIRAPDNRLHTLLFEQGELQEDEDHADPSEEDYDIRLRFWPDSTLLEPVFDYHATLELMRSFPDNDPTITITIIDAGFHIVQRFF